MIIVRTHSNFRSYIDRCQIAAENEAVSHPIYKQILIYGVIIIIITNFNISEALLRGVMPTDFVAGFLILSDDDPFAEPPPDFYKIPIDLNHGAGGHLIYLCYRKSDDEDDAPITGLEIIHGAHPEIEPPDGYEKIDSDLNAGAGGDYIYLCYSHNPDEGAPIKELAIVAAGNAHVPAPPGYTKLKTDLNNGAGGPYIFLCYQT